MATVKAAGIRVVLFYLTVVGCIITVMKWRYKRCSLIPRRTTTMKNIIHANKNREDARNMTFDGNMLTLEIGEKLQRALAKANASRKTILVWDTKAMMSSKAGSVPWNCGSCQLSWKQQRIYEKETKAVVIPYYSLKSGDMPPTSARRADQLYVWLARESPSALAITREMTFVREDAFQFNATMSYRRDADIYAPYGTLQQLYSDVDLEALSKSKTKNVISLVSNCRDTPAAKLRSTYLLLLSTLIPVDLVGQCFHSIKISKLDRQGLLNFLSPYKFYLAFENSYHCRDYITEKVFFNAIKANAVPIVWGPSREDYEAILPAKSFIHVEDFPSATQLADHLNYLLTNDSAYLEYFKWKLNPTNTANTRATSFCQLCRIVNGINVDDIYRTDYQETLPHRPLFEDEMSARRVSSIKDWIYNDNKECFGKYYKFSDTGIVVSYELS